MKFWTAVNDFNPWTCETAVMDVLAECLLEHYVGKSKGQDGGGIRSTEKEKPIKLPKELPYFLPSTRGWERVVAQVMKERNSYMGGGLSAFIRSAFNQGGS